MPEYHASLRTRATPIPNKQPRAKPAPKLSKDRPILPGGLNLAERIQRMVRVNHAGEFGAQRIYAGQLAVLKNKPCAPTIEHMARQEDEHLAAFEQMMMKRKIRPTALIPVWRVTGYALGALTAAMSEKAAMACTVAVEEVIDEHYQNQMRELGDNEPNLRALIKKFRNEEVEHKNIGLKHGAEDVPYYQALRKVIRAGSRTAIWLSERV